MQKFNLKIGGIKEMLSKEQMMKVGGGYCGGEVISTCLQCQVQGLEYWICYVSDGDCPGEKGACLLGGGYNCYQASC
ncbi:hypothetical protein [Mucilaginibacter jinjuensis]|uniref:Natural product n=1 Tax=Mucilaginibacter jinjuensis TaxID=1176721 RepID=A0ABY7TDS4_9SPHI|nr:hypothetical protein [Mucilaginibacter jinjuensis]WCT14486.1 hypothetical protein PQO05_11135 [Mucilaginibacter jinjuensis]